MKRKIDVQNAVDNSIAPFIECCDRFPEKRIFTVQKDNDSSDYITGKLFSEKIKRLGNALQKRLGPQEKAVLVFPQGLDYVCSLIACWYSNIITIPAPVADSVLKQQDTDKIGAIFKESGAACILTDTCFVEFLKTGKTCGSVPIYDVNQLMLEDPISGKERKHVPEDIALILYTSGSTSQPKGIMISHANLMLRTFTAAEQWEISQESCVVSWMPQFHSFGLLLNILAPLAKGASSVILEPGSFLKRPEFWLQMISRYRATHTGAPNFAFDYCFSSIDIRTAREYSLNTLKAIICGGEPIRKETFENFISKFDQIGLDKNIFCPHYGLSEMVVSTKKPGQPMRFLNLDIPSLEQGKVKCTKRKSKNKFVTSCGEIAENIEVQIVHPETSNTCSEDEIGEIWVKSTAAEVGYLKHNGKTEKAFSGKIEDTGAGGFLRTGDLGFVMDGHLYIVGREKDVIIIHGKNHHPVDIEWTIKESIPGVSFPCTVFSCEIDSREKVVAVQEIEETLTETEYGKIVREMMSAVSEAHGLEICGIDLVSKGNIPRTGSGKIQRKACRNAYLNNELKVIYKYWNENHSANGDIRGTTIKENRGIMEILKSEVFAPILGIEPSLIEAVSTFSGLGLDSIKYVQIAKRIEDVFKISFTPSILFKYRSLETLAEYLSDSSKGMHLPNEVNSRKENIVSGNPFQVNNGEIAVIGMSCHFPGGSVDLDSFWDNLVAQKDCITQISESRPGIVADCQKYYGEMIDSFPKWSGFIEDIDKFDAPFFGISPLEAESMDPQQRKLMELTWSVIEDGGYNPLNLAGEAVGLFVGAHSNDYAELVSRQPELMDTYGAFLDSGLHMSLVPHRVSRWFDFHGPSEVINTACSSSLIAIHHAVESIYRGESSMAIAGGINLILSSRTYCASQKAGMLSKAGRCKTFDEKGDGFVRGEGYGAVLLKPYDQALKDNDPVYGIIKIVEINHDGKSNSLRAPNLNAQKQLIKSAYQKSKLPLDTVSYIETHGTGTSLGDPIEFQALQEAFLEVKPDIANASCGLGAVKTNIGHCESAAGIAGVIKLLLSMKHRTLPGILHFEKLNPFIQLQNSPFYIITENRKWERLKDDQEREIPLRAGISSFGFGGANAHVIFEEHLTSGSVHKSTKPNRQTSTYIIPVSAKNRECLLAYAKRLSTFLKKHSESGKGFDSDTRNIDLKDIAYTLQTGRAAMEERAAFLTETVDELIQKLDAFSNGKELKIGFWNGRVKSVKDSPALSDGNGTACEPILKCISEGKADSIAQYWVEGGIVDWNLLYGQSEPKRLNLPAYAFARIRYWIPETEATSSLAAVCENTVKDSHDDDVKINRKPSFLHKQWESCPVVSTEKPGRKVAILATQETGKLARQLSACFSESKIIDIKDIGPDLGHEWGSFDGCVDIVGCGVQKEQNTDWVIFLQQLIEKEHKEGLMLLSVTRSVEPFQNKDINLSGALHAGLYRMLQSEYGHARSRHMDVEVTLDDTELAHQIKAEFFAESEDTEVCYRSGKRYRSSLGELDEAAGKSRIIAFPDDHVLFITGGTRGLGYLCAQHFVKNYGVRRLVLTGREVLPPREQWADYENRDSSIAKKIRAVQELEAEGAQVEVLSLALADEKAVMNSLEKMKDSMGPIGGLIHCAGLSDYENPAFIRKSAAGISKVLEPKVSGLEVLYRSLKNEPIQFFILFSSVSSIVPTLASGYSDYAMANAYMDYFAEAEAHNCPIISIQWPCWKETGMGEIKSKAYEKTGLLSHTNAEGLKLMDEVLSRDLGPVVMAAVVNPDRWEPHRLLQCSIPDACTKDEPVRFANEASVPATQTELTSAAENWLVSLFSKELRIDASTMETDKQFQDYGVDSILLAQLTRSINKILKEDLDPSILLEYSNIVSLTQWLTGNYAASLSEALSNQNIQPATSTVKTPPSPSTSTSTRGKGVEQQLKKETGYSRETDLGDIAVVGLSCRFPGAHDQEGYWRLLSQGRSAIGPVPQERWGYPNSFYAGLLDNIDRFDPEFFLIPKVDARVMDPQALILLEESLRLWYHAGYTHQEIKGKPVGVYIGARSQHQPDEYALKGARNPVVATGQNYLASNISQFFDLRGPSLVLDTACSSALVAMNMAVQSLISGEIESAIVGAVSLLNSDRSHRVFQQRGILSQKPAFHIFDQRANGIILGEGAGMVLLKTLDRALEDGDRIYAVIKGLAINNDGRTAGPATPNLLAQKEVMLAALVRSGKTTEDIGYIEVNGSGTEVTDLLELKAIQSVYRADSRTPLSLGSVKPNIGHPLSAEGIAGFIKVVMMLNHKQFVPFLSGVQPMTHFDLVSSPFTFVRRSTEWTSPYRTAAINCFADGGTNAHVILEAWDEQVSYPAKRSPLTAPALNLQKLYFDGEKQVPPLETQKSPELTKKFNWWVQSSSVNI